MAVKVVSDGPVKTKKVTCSKCCYMLEYTGIDVNAHHGDSGVYCHIVCPRPECREKVTVPQWRLE